SLDRSMLPFAEGRRASRAHYLFASRVSYFTRLSAPKCHESASSHTRRSGCMTQLLMQDSSHWLVGNWLSYDWLAYLRFLLGLLTLAGIVVAAAITTSWHD